MFPATLISLLEVPTIIWDFKMYTILCRLMLFICMLHYSKCFLHCSQKKQRSQSVFHLIQTCALSTSTTVLASDKLMTFQDCQQFAVENHGLALNFVNPRDLQDKNQDTCIVYDCPELDLSSLETETFFHYYSIYKNIDEESNHTCVPQVGMFVLHQEPANFSSAATICEEQGGMLAHVVSYERTSQLSALVSSLGAMRRVHFAYVGLSDMEQEGMFLTETGAPLDCFDYRGWAPGQPRSRFASEDCVVLDSRQCWRVVNCARRLPFICELGATVSISCTHIENKRYYERCLATQELERSKEMRKFQMCSRSADKE